MLTTLPGMDVASRIPRVRERFEASGIDGLLVSRLTNVRYLTGFTGSAAMVLITATDALLVTDGRYRDQSAEQIAESGASARVGVGTTQTRQSEILHEAASGLGRLGLEAHGVSWAQQRAFGEWFPEAELVATEHLVESFRMVKDEGEVARVRAACAIADDALADTLPMLQDQPTERDFALRLEFAMRERGASGVSFDAIVASGPNGAKPHARPSDRTIVPHELVVIDFGCIVDGYCSDMTRTVSVGDPGPDARHLWDTVLLSQQAGRAAVAVGVECSAVDRACRDIIDDAGWGEAFVHGTGHGVGLEIHEDPRVAATSSGTLAPGHVVTVEPGVYLPGVGGVRIEDTVVVTADGSIALTEFPKDLVL
jgi:Xaa-Pro aminopeptidase